MPTRTLNPHNRTFAEFAALENAAMRQSNPSAIGMARWLLQRTAIAVPQATAPSPALTRAQPLMARVTQVLTAPMRTSQIANAIGAKRSTVHEIMRRLLREGAVQQSYEVLPGGGKFIVWRKNGASRLPTVPDFEAPRVTIGVRA